MKVLGIDLASEKGITGMAIYDGTRVRAFSVKSDREILEAIKDERPNIVAIDAPLSRPKEGMWRKAESELLKRKIKVFSPLLPTMVPLTERGIRLKKSLKNKVIEVFPGAVFDRARIPRKNSQIAVAKLVKKVLNTNLEGAGNQHERDAAAAVIAGYLFSKGLAEHVGDKREGSIVIPKNKL
jgi:predicted nuclease with RNAse H fold